MLLIIICTRCLLRCLCGLRVMKCKKKDSWKLLHIVLMNRRIKCNKLELKVLLIVDVNR